MKPETYDKHFLVEHNDNSDHGRTSRLFARYEEAEEYAEEIVTSGPRGNEFHPAPATLRLRFYVIRRMHAPEDWAGYESPSHPVSGQSQ